jgi:hypothetical protein
MLTVQGDLRANVSRVEASVDAAVARLKVQEATIRKNANAVASADTLHRLAATEAARAVSVVAQDIKRYDVDLRRLVTAVALDAQQHGAALSNRTVALRGDVARLDAALVGAAAARTGQLRLFFEERACPDGWTEPSALRGYMLVARPEGGRAGTRFNAPLRHDERGRVGPHGHAVTVTDPGHAHATGVYLRGNNKQMPQAEPNSDDGSVRTEEAVTGIGVTVRNSTGEHYPIVHVLACVYVE